MESAMVHPGVVELAWSVATLRAGYNTTIVVISAALLGLAAGVVGAVAMLRQRAMMADVLAHCTLPGIAIAFLVATAMGAQGRSLPVLLAGATASAVLGVLVVQAIVARTRLRDDVAMAAVLSVFFGLGIVLLSVVQRMRTGTQGGLSHFIYGQAAAMQVHDAMLMGAVAILAAGVVAALLKEWRVLCFDPRFAQTMGLPVARLDLLLMALVVVVTVIGLQAVGLILVVAMLIIPAAAARLWTDRFGTMVLLSGAIGAAAGYIGVCISATFPRAPAGAVIVLTATCIFLISLLVAPRRGIVARLIGRRAHADGAPA